MTVPLISFPQSHCPQSVSNGTEKQMRALWWGGVGINDLRAAAAGQGTALRFPSKPSALVKGALEVSLRLWGQGAVNTGSILPRNQQGCCQHSAASAQRTKATDRVRGKETQRWEQEREFFFSNHNATVERSITSLISNTLFRLESW